MKNELIEALDAMKKLSPLLLAGAGGCSPMLPVCPVCSHPVR